MQKNLFLVRHATAEEGSMVFRDFERELTSRGIMEAARVGNYLSSKNIIFDNIIASPSFRTLKTAELIAERLKIDVDLINKSENLYGSGPRGYLSVLNEIPENAENVILVGHNPDISFFAEYLCKEDMGGGMEKGTCIQLSFTDLKWAELTNKMAKFENRTDAADLE